MKRIFLGLILAFATLAQASAADVAVSRQGYRAASHQGYRAAPSRVPLALRTLSKRSASVMASTPCWRGCTALCGADFQACLRFEPLVGCVDYNNACDLSCLRQCRLSGGPLVDWIDY
jgi:hypothetical protein